MGVFSSDHIYSYSQLSAIDECPYSFYLQKIEKDENGKPLEQQSNFFAEHGTLIHNLLEDWAKKKILAAEMPDEYVKRYPNEVVTKPPAMLAAKGYTEKAYDQGLEYCENFDEFPGYDVVSAEESFVVDIPMPDGTTRKLTGRIDLILRNQLTDELVCADHKSKSLREFAKHEDEMYRQQYLYSIFIKQKYGTFPQRLMFNLFKDGQLKDRSFSEEEYADALAWAARQIEKIESFELIDWLDMKDEPDFFCNEICSVRKYCPNGVLRPTPKGKRTNK